MTPTEARTELERLVAVPDDEIDLVRAALTIAAEEDAALDVDAWTHRIDGLASRAELPSTASEIERLETLQVLFFDELGFTGEGTDFDDPASSFLNMVVDRRRGLPIALSVLYVRLGRKLGLSCAGVGFPGHFLAKVTTANGEIFVDPFQRQRSVTEQELAARVARMRGHPPLERWMLAASPTRQILARMLRNLKNLYLRRKDPARAFAAADRILLLEPKAWEDLRDRGLLCETLGGVAAARRDLARYLEEVPHAPDANSIRSRLKLLENKPTLLN